MFTTKEMSAIFSRESRVQRMLDFEAALAQAEARAGIIPEPAAAAIADKCKAELFELSELFDEAAHAGTLAIPLVRTLSQVVEGEAGRFVHWGATSQDAMDTGLILQVREALEALIGELLALGTECASLAERHRATPMVGRTLLQHAAPITFGLKAAHWLSLTTAQTRRLRDLRGEVLVVQLGGASGTLASLEDKGVRVSELLAEELDLAVPDLPWHTDRDRLAAIAGALGVVAGAMAKIASDIVLQMQTEVAEVSESLETSKGGSSTMPHKRNPVDATAAIASARLALGIVPVVLSSMIQEHERAAGSWQAEWIAMPDLFLFTAGSVAGVRSALDGLEVDGERMRANLEASGGQVMAEALSMALATHIGRPDAHRIVADASRRAIEQGEDLRSVVADDDQVREHLSADALARIFDPTAYLGSTDEFIRRAVDSFRAVAKSIEVAT